MLEIKDYSNMSYEEQDLCKAEITKVAVEEYVARKLGEHLTSGNEYGYPELYALSETLKSATYSVKYHQEAVDKERAKAEKREEVEENA